MSEKFVVPGCFRADAKWPGDIIIRTKDGQGETVDFYCHSGSVCLASDFFDTALSSGWKEGQADGTSSNSQTLIRGMITMQDEDAETIKDFLFNLYPRFKLIINKHNCLKLLIFADKIDERGLIEACKAFAIKSAHEDPFVLLEHSARNGLEDVFRRSSSEVLKNFPFYTTQQGYTELSCRLRILFERAWNAWLLACHREVTKTHQGMWKQGYPPAHGDTLTQAWVALGEKLGQLSVEEFLQKTKNFSSDSVPIFEKIFKDVKTPCIEWDKNKNCPRGFEM